MLTPGDLKVLGNEHSRKGAFLDLSLDAAGPEHFDLLKAEIGHWIAPLTWRSERIGAPSAWWSHVPFAHWLISTTGPSCLVELGTHAGVSYSAFCEATITAGTGTRCFAVDTWKGDAQAGEYGEEVFEELRRFHDSRYNRLLDVAEVHV